MRWCWWAGSVSVVVVGDVSFFCVYIYIIMYIAIGRLPFMCRTGRHKTWCRTCVVNFQPCTSAQTNPTPDLVHRNPNPKPKPNPLGGSRSAGVATRLRHVFWWSFSKSLRAAAEKPASRPTMTHPARFVPTSPAHRARVGRVRSVCWVSLQRFRKGLSAYFFRHHGQNYQLALNFRS